MTKLPALRRLIISIHALHEESDRASHGKPTVESLISIHALHEESDCDVMRQVGVS